MSEEHKEPRFDVHAEILKCFQHIYERTGLRVASCDIEWAVGMGCADAISVEVTAKAP